MKIKDIPKIIEIGHSKDFTIKHKYQILNDYGKSRKKECQKNLKNFTN